MKIFKVLTAPGLALIICAFVFLPSLSPVEASPGVLPLLGEYALSAAIGHDQPAFHSVPRAGGFRADNAPQALTADFNEDGVIIRSGSVYWRWQLKAYGYGDSLTSVQPAKLNPTANRVEYQRGPLTEWYINGPLGLQQGFDLAAPPALKQAGEPLALLLNLSGNGRAELAAEKRGLRLTDPSGKPVLDYAGLLAYDATGRKLPTWLELAAGQLYLRVNDQGAVYPLRIDPWIQKARLTPLDGGPFERFGKTVAISGDTAIIGMPHARIDNQNDRGSVYIFVKPGGLETIGGWDSNLTPQAKLTAGDGAEGDMFGFAVAGDDDVVVVTSLVGAAYVFVKPVGGWVTTSTYTAKLTASDAGSADGFGWSVGISDDTIVVGAQDAGGPGAAYVFVKPVGGWSGPLTETAKLTAAAPGMRFGAAVGINGDTIIIGAYATFVGGHSNQGAAYIFVKPENGWSGSLTETAKLIAGDGEANDWFADTVAVSNKTVVIGTRYGNSSFGATYVYEQPPGGWVSTSTATARLIASDVISYGFGNSVAIDGDAIAVGAVFSDQKDTNRNSVYIFDRPPSGWVTTSTYTARLTPTEGLPFDSFGLTVAISGRTIVVGADETDVGANFSQGAAYIYELQVDLSVAKTVSPAIAVPGQPLTYTLEFSNSGSTLATHVIMTDTIPAGFTVQNISSSGVVITNVTPAGLMAQAVRPRRGTSLEPLAAPLSLNWQVQNLRPNQAGRIVIAGVLNPILPSGSLTTTTIIAGPGDTNPINNIRSATVMVFGSGSLLPSYLPLITKNH